MSGPRGEDQGGEPPGGPLCSHLHEVTAQYGGADGGPWAVPVTVTPQRKASWWAAQQPSAGWPVISAPRAYVEVLGVFGAFFAASVAAAGFLVAGSSLPTNVPGWPAAIPSTIDQVAVTALAVVVPVLVVGRRGLGRRDLGLAVRQVITPGAGIRMAAWAVLALMAGSLITGALTTDRFPLGRLTAPALTLNLFHGLQAGFLEETVVLAFVVATLEQARRPLPEIVTVAVVLRASYHIYYGLGVLGVLVWAPAFVWLYRRFRTIVPLIVVHSAWDVLAVLSVRWRGVGVVDGLLVLALLVTAPITWLVDRANRRPVPTGWPGPAPMPGSWSAGGPGTPAPLPPSGWYPDPAGTPQWRWWTGAQWWWQPAPRAEPTAQAAPAAQVVPAAPDPSPGEGAGGP